MNESKLDLQEAWCAEDGVENTGAVLWGGTKDV